MAEPEIDPNKPEYYLQRGLSLQDWRQHMFGEISKADTDLQNLGQEQDNAASAAPDEANGGDADGDCYTDDDSNPSALLDEEFQLSQEDRNASTQLANLSEHEGRYAHCFQDMTMQERDTLRDKKQALAAAEQQGGPDSLAVRNARLDLAIEKAEIIKAHGTPEEIAHADKIELAAQREQAMLGKVELDMQGKSPAEQRALAAAVLKPVSADANTAEPAAASSVPAPTTDFSQKGALESRFATALTRTDLPPSNPGPALVAAIMPPAQNFAPGGMR